MPVFTQAGFTPSNSAQADFVANNIWNNHPNRAFYSKLVTVSGGTQSCPSGQFTRLTFLTQDTLTFPGPPALDRVYIYDSGAYLAWVELTVTPITALIIITLMGDSTAGNTVFPLTTTPIVTPDSAGKVMATISARMFPFVGTDGQFSQGIAINPSATCTVTAAQFDLNCLGRF